MSVHHVPPSPRLTLRNVKPMQTKMYSLRNYPEWEHRPQEDSGTSSCRVTDAAAEVQLCCPDTVSPLLCVSDASSPRTFCLLRVFIRISREVFCDVPGVCPDPGLADGFLWPVRLSQPS